MSFVDNLEAALVANPPGGLDRAYVRAFFRRNRRELNDLVRSLVAQANAGGAQIQIDLDDVDRLRWPEDLIKPRARGQANIDAMNVLARGGPFTDDDKVTIARYSGWGAVGIERYASSFPADFPVPETRALVHEYYTPSKVWRAIAEALVRFRSQLPREEGVLEALEPSAGIGRALRMFDGWQSAGWPIHWTAVEASAVSARLLRALFSDADVFEGYAERWIAANLGRRFGLICSNPPYGPRGEARELDSGGYATAQAYIYFVIRTAELLAKNGIAVQIIPTGLMSSHTTAFTRHRAELLRRAHLLAAFRLPSEPETGATLADVAYENFVVDVLFLQGRGGIAATAPASDAAIVAGDYFTEYPEHVLGVVRRTGEEDDEEGGAAPGPKARRGMQVVGRFTGIPPFDPRPIDAVPVFVSTIRAKASRGGIGRDLAAGALAKDAPMSLQGAESLGLRADRHLAAVARGDAGGAGGGGELVRDFAAWFAAYGNPAEDTALHVAAEAGNVGIRRFLTLWTGSRPSAALGARVEASGYQGQPALLPFTDWLYRQRGGVPLAIEDLAAQASAFGILGRVDLARVRRELWPSGWRFDAPKVDPTASTTAADVAPTTIEPRDAYLTGSLWPKVDRIVILARTGDYEAAEQLRELHNAIGWTGGSQIVKESGPQQPWIPFDVLQRFAVKHADWPEDIGFRRVDELLMPTNVAAYGALDVTEDRRTPPFSRLAINFLGWVNGDKQLFVPERRKEKDADGNTVEVPADVIRREMEAGWLKSWAEWIVQQDEVLNTLEDAFNRRLRGYKPPSHSDAPIDIARWGTKVRPHGYQNEAARKLIANRCGLLAFDVGLGKTYTGIQTLAFARQEGWARRPVIIVPNTIAWKWVRDIQRCCPDYRVVVIGSKRWKVKLSTGRAASDEDVDQMDAETPAGVRKAWRWKSDKDTPDERARKWTDFQAGLYDVAIVTMSAFARQQIDRSFVERYVAGNIAIRRAITLSLDQADADDKNAEKKGGKRRTERQEADTFERVRAWVGAKLAPPKDWKYDPGIDWHALGIDFLMVDEAQNYKNLFYSAREGSPDRAASKRAWALDFRCASVREHSGGAGVVLLSATPMKNAATEFFNMLHLVNPAIWAQVGISDPEGFVNQFAEIAEKMVTGGDGKRTAQQVVTGFHHIEALKGVVYRWSTFKTAQQVGLKIPAVKRTMHVARRTEAQASMFARLFAELAEVQEKIRNAARAAKGNPSFLSVLRALREKKQGVHARLYLASVHPGLLSEAPEMRLPEAGPKLVQCADEIAKTKPQTCSVTVEGEQVWMQRDCATDGDASSPRGCAIEPETYCLDCAHIVFCDNVKVHGWMRELLVERGIPVDRIAILNAEEAEDLELRAQIAEGFNGKGDPGDEEYEAPRFDVVIANAVAYEGIDLQRRTCAIHHLDVPWEPATLQQRNGRGVRQGNRFSDVNINFYFVEGSSEKHRLDKIERKRGIMVSLFEEGAVNTNTVQADVVEADDDIADAFIELCPPELRELLAAGAEEERKNLEAERRQKARKAANRVLADAIQVARRLRKAEADDDLERAERLRGEAQEKERELRGFVNAGLWPYDWMSVAEYALDQEQVIVLEDGPALFEGLRLKILNERPDDDDDDDARRMRVVNEEEQDKKSIRMVITQVERDGGGIWFIYERNPTPVRMLASSLAREFGRLKITDANPIPHGAAWYAETFPSYTPAVDESRWDPGALTHHGRVFADVLWPRVVPGPRDTRRWRYPYVEAGALQVEPAMSWRPLRETVIPPTSEGWATFLHMVRNQRKVRYTEANTIAEQWWGRTLPLGSVGADLEVATDDSEVKPRGVAVPGGLRILDGGAR